MTFISTTGQALDQIERIKNLQVQLADFQRQITTGKKARLYKDLGTDGLVTQRARADFKSLDTYINNIDIADRRIKLMEAGLAEMQEQARNLENAIIGQTQQGEIELDVIQDLADNIFKFLTDLVNTKDGSRFLFGGSDSGTQPIVNTGLLDTYAVSQIDDWVNSVIDTDTFISNYRDTSVLNDTLVGYSSNISSAKDVYVRVDDNTEVDYTVLANTQGIRDILAVVGLVKNLTNEIDEISLDPDDPITTITPPGADNAERADNFYQIWNDLAAMLNNATDLLDNERFKLSQVQANLNTIKVNHENAQNLLLGTISEVEDADMSEVALKVNFLQVQLEASFRVTASVSQLTLVNFI